MRIDIGAQATGRTDRGMGVITDLYKEGDATVLVIDQEYEVLVRPGEVEEVVDLTRGLRWYRLLRH